MDVSLPMNRPDIMPMQWSSKNSINQTRRLDIRLDPTVDDQPATAILLSRMLQSIERRCPAISISLSFMRCKCDATPVSNFGMESFPRVRDLSLYLGRFDPEETHQRTRDTCFPDSNFWNPFFDGMTFPDLESIEIRHFWRVQPDHTASLDISQFAGTLENERPYAASRSRLKGPSKTSSSEPMLDLTGLEKLRKIKLEYVPELDAGILTQLLGNPDSTAANLTHLELRFCNLGEEIIEQLLFHAPPSLQHFVLLLRDNEAVAQPPWHNEQKTAHLCPLLRRYAKCLNHLEFGASRICRQLFLDDLEIEGLRQDGISTALGTEGGSLLHQDMFDQSAIERTVQKCRDRKDADERQIFIDEAVAHRKSRSQAFAKPVSLFGSSQSDLGLEEIRRNSERLLDEKAEKRARIISSSKTPFFRRYITWDNLVSTPGISIE